MLFQIIQDLVWSWLFIKRSRMNAFWTNCIPLFNFRSFRTSCFCFNWFWKSERWVQDYSFFYFTSHLPASFLLPSLFLHDPFFVCLFDYVCGLNTTKKKYQTTSKVILWVLIALYFHQILSNFPTGKRIPLWEITASHVCQMSLNLVNSLIKMKWSSYYDT